jgi:hypothetical protein
LPGWGKLGGGISDGIAQAQRGEIYRRDAHVADEPTPRVVGLVASEYLLATTGRCNRRWDGRHPEMTEDACNNRLMGDGSNDPQCATVAQKGHVTISRANTRPSSLAHFP